MEEEVNLRIARAAAIFGRRKRKKKVSHAVM
jgi:hypothetical protein